MQSDSPDILTPHAKKPTQMSGAAWWQIVKRVFWDVINDHVSVVAAGVAFFGLLSIFPAATALISLAGYVLQPEDVQSQLESLVDLLPEDAAAIISDQVLQLTGGDSTATGLAALFALLLTLYGAMRGVKTLMEGINIAYGERETRSFVRLNLTAIALTLVLLIGLIVSLNVVITIPATMAFLGLPAEIELLVSAIKWVVLTAMTVGGLSLLYRFAPARRHARWRWVSPGAVVATFLWMIGTVGFSVYVSNFGSYNETYGALGGVIILLTWLWLSAFIVLLGAELNAGIELQTLADTTVGRERPMGERGAYVADTYPGDQRPTARELAEEVAPERETAPLKRAPSLGN
ncbi:YihY/virulence factor BrkB family protein [Roseivivax sp. CAU 1761]